MATSLKPKLTIKEQIQYMKDKMGIKFTYIDELKAEQYLSNSIYFFKLKAFAKNYPKFTNEGSKKFGKYVNLEFAYLKELARLDSLFRKLILNMVLDVEHFLKVQLLRDIANNANEDGYNIVYEIFEQNPNLKSSILRCNRDSYTYDVIQRNRDNIPAWLLVEVVSFGELIEFYKQYYDVKYSEERNNKLTNNQTYPIKRLRNAAAHNNCLLNNLSSNKEISLDRDLSFKLSTQISNISSNSRNAKLKNPLIHDFIVLLDVYCEIIKSKSTLNDGLNAVNHFLKKECLEKKDYFKSNDDIRSNYEFLVKVFDYYLQKNNIKIAQK